MVTLSNLEERLEHSEECVTVFDAMTTLQNSPGKELRAACSEVPIGCSDHVLVRDPSPAGRTRLEGREAAREHGDGLREVQPRARRVRPEDLPHSDNSTEGVVAQPALPCAKWSRRVPEAGWGVSSWLAWSCSRRKMASSTRNSPPRSAFEVKQSPNLVPQDRFRREHGEIAKTNSCQPFHLNLRVALLTLTLLLRMKIPGRRSDIYGPQGGRGEFRSRCALRVPRGVRPERVQHLTASEDHHHAGGHHARHRKARAPVPRLRRALEDAQQGRTSAHRDSVAIQHTLRRFWWS